MTNARSTTKFTKEIEKAPKVSAKELLKDCDYKGYMTKQGGSFKSWKKRLCILHSGRLYYFVKKTDSVPKGMINVIGLSCDHVKNKALVNDRPYGLRIISPHRTYYVCAESEEEANEWLKAINESAALNAEHMIHVVDNNKSSDVIFHTIEEAVAQANDEDIIMVRNGTYVLNETLKITKPVHLRGVFEQEGGRNLVVIGLSSAATVTSNEPVIHVQNTFKKVFSLSHVTICLRPDMVEANKKMQKKNPKMINGTTDIDGSSDKYSSHCCIKVTGTSQCSIYDVEVTCSMGQGILVTNDATLSMEKSMIRCNSQNGVVVCEGAFAAIKASSFEENGHFGILIKDNAKASISYSNFSQNLSHAIRHESSIGADVENNTFTLKGESDKPREPHISIKDGCNVTISGNSME